MTYPKSARPGGSHSAGFTVRPWFTSTSTRSWLPLFPWGPRISNRPRKTPLSQTSLQLCNTGSFTSINFFLFLFWMLIKLVQVLQALGTKDLYLPSNLCIYIGRMDSSKYTIFKESMKVKLCKIFIRISQDFRTFTISFQLPVMYEVLI